MSATAGSRSSKRTPSAAAAASPLSSCPVLARFAAAWEALAPTLPAAARVRMEGADPSALSARQAAWLALGYPLKWATTTYACPPEVRAHFAAHAAALLALSGADCAAADCAPAVRLGLVGDCMWVRDTWSAFATDCTRAAMDACDALVANLETPLHDRTPRDPLWLAQSLLPDMVTYSSPIEFLDAFKRRAKRPRVADTAAGPPLMGAFTTANNHSADMGPAGARATLAALDAAGIPHAGVRLDGATRSWCSFERAAGGGTGPVLRVGVYAATFGVNFPVKAAQCAASGVHVQTVPGLAAASATGCGEVDLSEACAALAEMAQAGCGLRIVAIHWGHEFEGYPTVPQMSVARALARAGADVVLGAHAHVAQPAEVLLLNGYVGNGAAECAALAALPAASRLDGAPGPPRKALVLYCLGNFCTTMFNELCRVGTLLTLQVTPPAGDTSAAAAPWDWRLPTWHWLYNEARVLLRVPFVPPRRLLYIARDGADGCAAAAANRGSADAGLPCDDAALLAPRKRALLEFSRAHVLGGDAASRVPPPMRF